MITDNIILLTDSYKVTHWKQYKPGTSNVYSYFESRGGLFPEVVFFGLQYYLQEYLSKPVTMEMIDEAESYFTGHFGDKSLFNREAWEYIVTEHDGKLPIRIKAVPEGTVVKVSNTMMSVEATDPKCYWLTNYMETVLSQVWYGSTVATYSREIKKVINQYLEKTGDTSGINFKLHDFGFRGVSSVESSGVGGAAHLVNFMGTDTLSALVVARKNYSSDIAGFSIPASEHSTMTSWGGQYSEVDAMRNMIKQYGSSPIFACVSDSYDVYRACKEYWGKQLKDDLMEVDGTLVVRPDSGTPHKVTLECIELLGEAFGYSVNEKSYKVLDPKVRLIWGDGIDYDGVRKILSTLEQNGWSADNIAFGMGGGLLQKLNRDTQKFAFKCSSMTDERGNEHDVYKAPITDGGKTSKKGRMSLVEGKTVKKDNHPEDMLKVVYENGEVKLTTTLDEIRDRAKL